ncbi:MAG: hypothetical protein B6I20_01440 [Bacteroidetes bacterium 4572_117]|nr:MAG: hypothetical protein B6I20_01440 [Bacteroidetes bacterium 4572_117]
MNKKETIIPITVAVLTVLFAIISLAVFFSKGKSGFWLSKKMKVGALLLTFSTVTTYSCVSCYDMPAPANRFIIENLDGYKINLDLNIDNKINGTIEDRDGINFSFNITDTLRSDTLQIDNILPADGLFDSYVEDFTILVDENLQNGTYYLNLFAEDKDKQQQFRDIYRLNIR